MNDFFTFNLAQILTCLLLIYITFNKYETNRKHFNSINNLITKHNNRRSNLFHCFRNSKFS